MAPATVLGLLFPSLSLFKTCISYFWTVPSGCTVCIILKCTHFVATPYNLPPSLTKSESSPVGRHLLLLNSLSACSSQNPGIHLNSLLCQSPFVFISLMPVKQSSFLFPAVSHLVPSLLLPLIVVITPYLVFFSQLYIHLSGFSKILGQIIFLFRCYQRYPLLLGEGETAYLRCVGSGPC